jgi:hypothetical protein
MIESVCCQFTTETGMSICGARPALFVDDLGRPLCAAHGPHCPTCGAAAMELDLRDGQRWCSVHVPKVRASVSPGEWSELCGLELSRTRG